MFYLKICVKTNCVVMSTSEKDPSKTPPTATIKIAPSEQSQRQSTGADPGPGDPNAAPSVAPQLVDIPDAPTPSELVVKSSTEPKSGSRLTTLQPGRSAIKSTIASSMAGGAPPTSMSGSKAGPAASNASMGAPREATSSRPLTGPPSVGGVSSRTGAAGVGSTTGSQAMSRTGAAGPSGGGGASQAGLASGRSASGAAGTEGGASPSPSGSSADHEPTSPGSGASSQKTSPSPSQSRSPMSAGSGNVVHDEDEVGEGELEHPQSGVSAAKTVHSGQTNASGVSPMSSTGSHKTAEPSTSAASSAKSEGGAISNMLKTDNSKDKKKKVTKFRYHKRITVRTTGKTSPAAVMDKVNKKARITPSTIEDLDPQELMKRAGIKGNKQTHWRVRLRQTKRVTKNGKTTTQTKVAYRDSEGNKRVKLSSNPNCKKCGKKLEECKCDTNSTS